MTIKKTWLTAALTKSSLSGDCMEFNGGKARGGYGLIRSNGKKQYVHRLSYERFKGEIPEGLIVRHTCDNPSCWNPSHLILGTQADNMRDMVDRGRGKIPDNKGSNHGNSKLTETKVIEIKQLLSQGILGKDIAEMYSVSRPQISLIRNNKQWKHVKIEGLES